ncbi:MAG TPA: hypothetical protein ENK57_09195 [Polyangiaceae bacterium]|nr:hypothetical protein [Polyangiaceae bacterium]
MRKPVLADHKRQGSRFIPPMIHRMPAPMKYTSWPTTELPEVVWLSLLHRRHGDQRAAMLITALSRSVRKHVAEPLSRIFGAVTHYASVSDAEWSAVRSDLGGNGDLLLLQEAIRPLVVLYPECPLRGIYFNPPTEQEDGDLFLMAQTVGELFDQQLRSTVMAQASYTWLAFDADVLKVAPLLALAEFPKVQDYPDTELSRRIASSIRAGLHGFFNPPHYTEEPAAWVRYFWNRGVEISPCFFLDRNEVEDDQ